MQRPRLRPCAPPRDGAGGRDVDVLATLREPAPAPALKITDPAVRAMTDFRQETAPTLTEELTLEQALDRMFRMGVRASLVVRDGVVTGLLTAEAARAARSLPRRAAPRVSDAMMPSDEVPAVDWQVIEEGQIRDLIEILEGSGAQHLLVLENATPTLIDVRGLVHRERLERQLGSRWPMRTLPLAQIAGQ